MVDGSIFFSGSHRSHRHRQCHVRHCLYLVRACRGLALSCRRRFDSVYPVKSSPEFLLTLVVCLVARFCHRFLQRRFKRNHQDSLLERIDAASRKIKHFPLAISKTMIPSFHASPSTKASASFCSSLRNPVLGGLNRPMAAINFSSVPKYRFGGAFCGLDSGLRRRRQSHLGLPQSREAQISSSLE